MGGPILNAAYKRIGHEKRAHYECVAIKIDSDCVVLRYADGCEMLVDIKNEFENKFILVETPDAIFREMLSK